MHVTLTVLAVCVMIRSFALGSSRSASRALKTEDGHREKGDGERAQIDRDDVERAMSVVRTGNRVVRVFDPLPRLEVWKSFRYQRAYLQSADLYIVSPDPNGLEIPWDETAEHLFLASGKPVLGMHHLAFNLPATRFIRLGDPATFADPSGLYAVVSFGKQDSEQLSEAANRIPDLI